ncbi:histone H2B.3-like [Parasteatoda tepidariorum]|uniref:histone H2B.3-like n=1 Tax=Parasteatoda tepidariorum TaxID=114398 RepID=UPI0039BD661C
MESKNIKKGKRRKSQRRFVRGLSFQSYVRKLLRIIDEQASISRSAQEKMDTLILDMFDQLCQETDNFMIIHEKQQLMPLDVQCAIMSVLKGRLRRKAFENATQAIVWYYNEKGT